MNIRPDLSHFGLIVPCGITEGGVTSMERELGRAVEPEAVRQRIIEHFGAVFECSVAMAPAPEETVSVVIRHADDVLLLRRTPERGGFWQPVTGRVEAGETTLQAAQRELREETSFETPVRAIDYRHAFPWGAAAPPRVAIETAHVALVSERANPRLSDEHDAFEWVDLATALSRVPFAGFKRALTRAAALKA